MASQWQRHLFLALILHALTATARAASAPAAGLVEPPRASVQVTGGWAQVPTLRVAGALDVGLARGFGLRLLAGPSLCGRKVEGRMLLGPTWGLDAFTWVPRIGILAGLALPSGRLEIQGGLELGRFVRMRVATVVGLWGSWSQAHGFGGLLTLGLQRELGF